MVPPASQVDGLSRRRALRVVAAENVPSPATARNGDRHSVLVDVGHGAAAPGARAQATRACLERQVCASRNWVFGDP